MSVFLSVYLPAWRNKGTIHKEWNESISNRYVLIRRPCSDMIWRLINCRIIIIIITTLMHQIQFRLRLCPNPVRQLMRSLISALGKPLLSRERKEGRGARADPGLVNGGPRGWGLELERGCPPTQRGGVRRGGCAPPQKLFFEFLS